PGRLASIRPSFFRTTIRPVFLPGSATLSKRARRAPTSTIFAPLSLTAPKGSPIPAPKDGSRQVQRFAFPPPHIGPSFAFRDGIRADARDGPCRLPSVQQHR